MRAIIFPGQGCQKQGMGYDLYTKFPKARDIFEQANSILGWRITDTMFFGTEEELMETCNTQLAVFIYEVALTLAQNEILANMVAGHSLGEFSALVVAGGITFEDGLNIVRHRALLGQKVCKNYATGMGAVIGLHDAYVSKRIKEIWDESGEPLYLANYNGPGQVVITGSRKGVRLACKTFKAEGAKKAVPLAIGGSFHSPYMNEVKEQLGKIIRDIKLSKPRIPIYQCVDALPHTNIEEIRKNLIEHITHPVLWTDMVDNMHKDGVDTFYEAGTDDTLQKIVKRMKPNAFVSSLLHIPLYEGQIKDYSIIKE